jgi:hypothetical protein
MLTDSLTTIVLQSHWPWFWFVASYVLLDIAANSSFLHRRGEFKQTLKNDSLLLIWPLFILAPATAFFFYTGQTGAILEAHLFSLNRTDVFILSKQKQSLLLGIIVLAAIILTGISYWRYERMDREKPHGKRRFFTRNVYFHAFRAFLFDLPLTFMIIVAGVRVIEQSLIIRRLLTSLPIPDSFLFPADSMYGYRWVYDIILHYSILGVLLSFLPVVMLIREKNTHYSFGYKMVVFILEIVVIVLSFSLARDFHLTLQSIHYHFLYHLSADIITDTNILRHLTDSEIIRQALYLDLRNQLLTLPKGFPLPSWLQSILGLRFLTWIIEIYPLIPEKMRHRIPIISKINNLSSFLPTSFVNLFPQKH